MDPIFGPDPARTAALLALALPLAWAVDAFIGEPRNRLHPVAWLGHLLRPLGHWLRQRRPVLAFAGGSLAWLVLAVGLGAAAWALQAGLQRLPVPLAVPLLALALKPMFAWRMLRDEVVAVEAALAAGEGEHIDAARTRLAGLVSRDVKTLDAADVREAAIETLAENLNDSVVAPLFWYVLFGLPGAVVYRFANTADAMWGYRGAWEWAGKWAACADDVLSWLPARLTAALLRPTLRCRDWQDLRREARRTPSPNSGWPMGAMALRLGVRLCKPGVYALNDAAPRPQAAQLGLALQHAAAAAGAAVVLATLGWLLRLAGVAWG